MNFLHTHTLTAKRAKHLFFTALLVMTLSACGPTRPPERSKGHISHSDVQTKQAIPEPVTRAPLLPPPQSRAAVETYTVIVSDVPVKKLLFSIARDAKINLDIHDDIQGRVTLNAIDQTLAQLLERISEQVEIRYRLEKNSLRIRADKPYLETYKVDYVNISRTSKGTVRVSTNLSSTGQGNIGNDQGSNINEGNSSLTEVSLKSDNLFWETLSHNIIEMISEPEAGHAPKSMPIQAKETSGDVIVNREAGMIMVRATAKQHRQIQAFIDQVLNNSKRQVMIEATIAEIKLSDRYQAGVDWSKISADPVHGFNVLTDLRGSNLAQPPFSSFTVNGTSDGDLVSGTLRALEQFGDVKVLSSPKVMAINNQPAILKVVDNIVYFEMDVDTSVNQTTTQTTFETEIKTVPVGFVMSVTPYINEHDVVTLNIRPTISRVIDSVEDPNPAFKNANVISEVPVIQVREIESILTINSGETAVIGGLMQDTVNDNQSGIPFLSNIPLIGSLFRYEDDLREKSELVIFIRPRVIRHASIETDLSSFKPFLPGAAAGTESEDSGADKQLPAESND